MVHACKICSCFFVKICLVMSDALFAVYLGLKNRQAVSCSRRHEFNTSVAIICQFKQFCMSIMSSHQRTNVVYHFSYFHVVFRFNSWPTFSCLFISVAHVFSNIYGCRSVNVISGHYYRYACTCFIEFLAKLSKLCFIFKLH